MPQPAEQIASLPLFVFNIHAIPPLITSLAMLSLGLFVIVREKGSRVSLVYLGYTLSAASWLLCASIALFLRSEALAYRWMTFASGGVTLIPASLYHFTVVALEADRRYRGRILFAWTLSSLYLVLVLFTNILFDGFYHYSWGIFLRFRWPSYLFTIYFFAMMVETLRLYWREFRRTKKGTAAHHRARAFLIAFGIGYLGALDFLPAMGISYYPMSSLPMTCMLILVARAIWRYRLVDITPAFAAREIIDHMSDALVVLDRENIVRLVNRAACDILGCRHEDVTGRQSSDVLAHCRELLNALDVSGDGEFLRSREVVCFSPDGTDRALSLSTSFLHSTIGERVATVCLIRDITDRKRADEERDRLISRLRDMNEQLRSVDKLKTNFISMVSHELRTPLTTIKAFIELLLIKQHMPEGQRLKLMSTINEETDRLARLITDLLDLARIESGSMKWQMEELSLEPLIAKVITSMGPLFEKKELTITTCFNAPSCLVRGDRDRLVQVVTNILSNAAKFTPVRGAISVGVRRDASAKDRILVEVSDTGIGIQTKDLGMIFEKFHRSDDTRAAAIEGTGLGLAIAREIVETHGGSIWATSVYGKGSAFYFSVPLARTTQV